MGYTVNGHSVWFILLITFLTSFLLVPFVKKLAFHIDAVDYPNQRRINKVPMPDLGGLAVVFFFLIWIYFIWSRECANDCHFNVFFPCNYDGPL